jgi:ubiquinone/menaquinone biosynthesis C-methylase UbiE
MTSAPGSTTTKARPEAYLLGTSAAELEHLVAQAEVYAPEANELLDRIGLEPGGSAIDVGCGALGVVDLLAERVGADGRVLGLDREAPMVELARRLAAARGLSVEFVQADATASGLPEAGFDLVHARTLLLNVTNPQEILAEMVRIARPGGLVAVQEPDASGWVCDPPHPAWDTLRGAIVSAYRRSGRDFNIGRRIARMLRDAGVQDVRARATARVTQPGEYYHTFLLTIAGLVRDEIVAGGELTADELESYTNALQVHLDTPGALTSQPLMWQAWGRVRTGADRGPRTPTTA